MGSFEHLNALLNRFVANGPPGCALAVSHRGEIKYRAFVGSADVETGRPIEEDTIYRIYSMSKIVTCVAALTLYEEGKFLLNEPLSDILPEYKDVRVYRGAPNGTIAAAPAVHPIRIKDLFTMSSGLTYGGAGSPTARDTAQVVESLRGAEDRGSYTIRELAKALASVPLAFEPGTQWQYGLSHDVLAAVVEVVSGQRFGEFLQRRIFEPLGMTDTFFRIPEAKRHRLASLYDRSDAGVLTKNDRMDANYRPEATFESGGGGLLSTLGDYTRFVQALAAGGEWNGERILGRKTIDLMATNHLSDRQLKDYNWPYLAGYGYGLGVRVMMDPAAGGSNSSLGEFGWSGLAGTWALIDLKEQVCAVYMQQMMPNFEAIHQPRLRNAIYGAL